VTRGALQVLDDAMRAYGSPAELRAALGASGARRFRASMWPPAGCAADALQHCLRLYPHLNDTGGFFVAVLRKTHPWPPAPAPRPQRPLAAPRGRPRAQSWRLLPDEALAAALRPWHVRDMRGRVALLAASPTPRRCSSARGARPGGARRRVARRAQRSGPLQSPRRVPGCAGAGAESSLTGCVRARGTTR
jgi:hypothetical protein